MLSSLSHSSKIECYTLSNERNSMMFSEGLFLLNPYLLASSLYSGCSRTVLRILFIVIILNWLGRVQLTVVFSIC